MRALVLAYVVTLPLVRADFLTLPLGKALVPSDLVFLALLLALGVNRARWRWPETRLFLAAALPPAAMLLSALLTAAPRRIAALELLRTAYSMLVLLTMAALPHDEQLQRDVTRTWCATSILVCAVGLVSYLAVTVFGAPENPLARANSDVLGPGVVRISGAFPTNSLTLYLVVSAAFAIALREHGQTSRERGLGRAAFAWAVAMSAASFSRGVLGLFVFLGLLAFRRDLAPRRLTTLRWPMAAATATLAVATMVATWWAIFPLQRLDSARWELNRQPSVYRVMHIAGLRMFVAHPITGVGPGGFGARLADFSTADERSTSWPPVGASLNWISHSSWIGFLAEGGLPLFAAWIAVLAPLIRHLVDSPERDLRPLLGLALVGIAVNGLHVNFEHLKFIWAAVGLALCGRKAPGLARGD